MVVLRKNTCTIELQARLATYFYVSSFLLERTGRQAMDIYTWAFADIFSKIIKMILSLQGKQPIVFVTNDKMICCQVKIQNFGKFVFHHHELDNIPVLKRISDEISCDINRCNNFF